MEILNIVARQIFDSRGNPTVQVDLTTEQGTFTANVPSGASTGIHEALELRDGGNAYGGKGVSKAVANVNEQIASMLKGKSVLDQAELDKAMCEADGTENKSKFGANAILGVSLAIARAGAAAKGIELYEHISQLAGTTPQLPMPCMNIINGGEHADNGLSVQEFMLVPTSAESFSQAMRMGTEIYHELKKLLKTKYGGGATAVGDEGGFAPQIESSMEAVQLVKEASKNCGYDTSLALDAAASEYFKEGKYIYEGKELSGDELIESYKELVAQGIVSFEDPFDQDDFDHYAKFKEAVTCQVVGDDLTVTNPKRIQRAIEHNACNSLLLKVNQIGSVTESIEAAMLAKSAGWTVMVSHRSGETEDAFIADLAVGLGCGQIKTGAPCRSERVAKYNRLLQIEEKLSKFGTNFNWAE